MEVLKEYAVNIIVVSIIVSIFESMAPDSNGKKHIELVCGLVIMLCILKPVSFLSDLRADIFSIPQFSIENAEKENELLKKAFEENLKETISNEIYNKFGKKVDVFVCVDFAQDIEKYVIKSINADTSDEKIKSFVKEKFENGTIDGG